MNASAFDRGAEDLGNIVHLEHLNLTVPDQLLATRFYVSALGLTRDPYLMTGIDNMWVNAGRTQFHLPVAGRAQRMRGTVTLVLPEHESLLARLAVAARTPLADTEFGFEEQSDGVAVRCPWGNRILCVEPEAECWGTTTLGIVELAFDVPPGAADGIARFYRELLGARADAQHGVARVQAGVAQTLLFRERAEPPPPYDGHHIQIYLADFSGPHRRLAELGRVTEESDRHQYRFGDIVDPADGKPLFQLEHEVRSLTHPLYGRTLVNRNPLQSNRDYRPGADAFFPA